MSYLKIRSVFELERISNFRLDYDKCLSEDFEKNRIIEICAKTCFFQNYFNLQPTEKFCN